MSQNALYYGDNLDVLRRHIKDESVDLVYLDPPFNSNQDYNVLFAERNGTRSAAQIMAFEDTWQWDQGAAEAYEEIVEAGGRVSQAMQAFRSFLGENDMMAYLAMMAPRLVELKRVLRSTGSIYLHCDSTANHYLKMLMDSIFDSASFRSEIIWRRTNAKGLAFKGYPNNHDVLLYYVRGESFVWNRPFGEHDPEYLQKFYRFVEKETGRRYRLSDLTNPNRNRPNLTYEWKGHKRVWRWTKERMAAADKKGLIHYSSTGLAAQKRYLDEVQGQPIDTIWDDISPIQAQATERLGYPTQKPEALLERIIKASSNEGDVILDPFCGCGTAVAAAQKLNRQWVGIDITHLAITLIKHRLRDAFGDAIAKTYQVIGEPVSLPDAKQLAADDPYQFQWWTLGLVGARPVEQKKGADKGIDGRLYFHDEPGGKTKQIILSVKAGHITVSHVRDLRGVIDREKAEIGVLLCMEEPTKPMRAEAAGAGFYKTPYGNHPKLQILTVGQLLEGARIDYPPQYAREDKTFKKAPKAMKPGPTQKGLPMAAESDAPYGD